MIKYFQVTRWLIGISSRFKTTWEGDGNFSKSARQFSRWRRDGGGGKQHGGQKINHRNKEYVTFKKIIHRNKEYVTFKENKYVNMIKLYL